MSREIMRGKSAGFFATNDSSTRAEVAKIAVKIFEVVE